MKKTLLILAAALTMTSAAELTADAILDSLEKNENAKTSRIEMTQNVYKANGTVAVSELISYSAGEGEKGLMVYEKPARIKGMKILTLNDGDDIWFYSPRTARTRKIASHQKNQSVNGSDFSYDDLSTSDRREDFDTKITGTEEYEGVSCTVLEMTKKADSDVTYSKMKMLVDTDRWIPLRAEMYDETGDLWKVLTMKDIAKVGIYWNAKVITMENVQKETKTEMISSKVEFDIPVDETMFTERYLSR